MPYRDLISEVHSGGVRLSEDDPTLRLLIEGLYDANMAVSEENLEPLLELSRCADPFLVNFAHCTAALRLPWRI